MKSMPPLRVKALHVEESVAFHWPQADSEWFPEKFLFSVGEQQIRMSAAGQVEVQEGKHIVGRYSLPIPDEDVIGEFVYGRFRGDLIFCAETHEAGRGSISLLRFEPTKGTVKWSVELASFNLGEPLAVGDKLYVTALGFVGKMDLETGKFDWKHEGFYTDGAYNAFLKPRLGKDVVIFVENSVIREGEEALYVLVEEATGRLLTIWEGVGEDWLHVF